MISVVFSLAATAAEGQAEPLMSQSTADLFVRQARMIQAEAHPDSRQIEQAMTFLDAALALNETSASVPPQLLRLAADARYVDKDYSQSIHWALRQEVTPRADLAVLNGAVATLLEQQQSRLDREVLLEQLLKQYAGINPFFGSDLATQLALLTAEKADMEGAMNQLSYAYELNPHNELAFLKLQELSQAQGLSVTPAAYLVALRRALDRNPYDLNGAVDYAETLKQLEQFETAAAAYRYAADVHAFLYPGQALSDSIFLPWILCAYHASGPTETYLDAIERYRRERDWDLTVEAVVGKIQLKLGRTEAGRKTLTQAAQRAEEQLSAGSGAVTPERLAWFYGVVLDQPENALAWANRAWKAEPDRASVAALFAYTLARNGQMDLAAEYAAPYEQTSPVAALTLALTATADETARAIERLKAAIAMAPESFVAETARQQLTELGSASLVPAYATAAVQALTEAYEQRLVPRFAAPAERLNVKLMFAGTAFAYGQSWDARLVIENTAAAPLVIGPGGLLRGRLRVDAALSGDLNVRIPNVVSTAFRPSAVVAPGEHLSVPLVLDAGKLARILMTYPQADVAVQLTAYLDPVEADSETPRHGLTGLAPVAATIKRPGVTMSRDFLMQRLDTLGQGRPGQKFRAVRLFAALAAEQKAFAISGADFQYVQVDPALLADSVRRPLNDENWTVRVEVMDALLSLSVPLEAAVLTDLSANLNAPEWPVRLMALALLAKAQPETFGPVLDWTARHDPQWLNRRMAVALGATPPETDAAATDKP